MVTAVETRIDRIRSWLARVEPVLLPRGIEQQQVREHWSTQTGLSAPNVDWALKHSLELYPTTTELERLVASVPESPTAHVLLSANVFTMPLRAIALGLASSPSVRVRPSRRARAFAELLHRASPEAFTLVEALMPRVGDHLWAFGGDDTMVALAQSLVPGVTLHAHGDGYGVIALETPELLSDDDYDSMALDIAAFDQRGCLSPRVVAVQAREAEIHRVATRLNSALARMQERIPCGRLTESEQSARVAHRELFKFLGVALDGPHGLVTHAFEDIPWTIAPSGRVIHIHRSSCLLETLAAVEPMLTTVGTRGALLEELPKHLRHARITRIGTMQTPPLDGPVDRRAPREGRLISARTS